MREREARATPMVSCAGPRINAKTSMHIVIAAWLFVIGTMALTSASALGGLVFFIVAGVAPVGFYAWARVRALRRRRSGS